MANLYRVMVVLRQPQANIILTFLSEESAKSTHQNILAGVATVADDFGNIAAIERDQIAAVMFTDIGRDLEGQKQLALMTARANSKAQREAQADPLIAKQPNQNFAVPPGIPPFTRQ